MNEIKQRTQKSISISAEAYKELENFAKANGVSCAGIVELETKRFLDRVGFVSPWQGES